MEKYRFKSTVYLVFLLVSLFVNGLLLYMLIVDNPVKEKEEVKEGPNISELERKANDIYRESYNIINRENSDFYMLSDYKNKLNLSNACYTVDLNSLSGVFTDRLLKVLSNDLLLDNNIFYDCDETMHRKLFTSLFGVTDQGLSELKYVTSNEDTLVLRRKLEGNDFIKGDDYYLYIILKLENGKYLIDSFE